MDFGQNDSLALEDLSQAMYESLRQQFAIIHSHVKIEVDMVEKPLLQRVDDRYTLKAVIPIKGVEGADKIVVVGFAPGDGTGSNEDFPNLLAPENFKPRYKKHVAEFFIPVGTLYNDDFIPRVNSLDELTLNDKGNLTFLTSHATHPHSYQWSLSDLNDFSSATFLTRPVSLTYYNDNMTSANDAVSNKKSFGNPHSIIFDENIVHSVNSGYKNWIQLGAFIEFKESSPELKMMNLYSYASVPLSVDFDSGKARSSR